ncbi:MAG: hypothetical protein P8171_23400 [Candidatus Thiodiazotropha sp.]
MKKKIIYVTAVLLLLGFFLIFGLIGVYETENGIVLGLPDYEKREIHVSQVDLDILTKANALLSGESRWRKERVSSCSQSEKLDLYCALEKASVDVMGKYIHRQPALQEVRFSIDDHYRERWKKHRLVEFNSNNYTNFRDVKSVLSQAIATVRGKLVLYKENE